MAFSKIRSESRNLYESLPDGKEEFLAVESESDSDDDDSTALPEPLIHFVNCPKCDTPFNAAFTVFGFNSKEDRQMGSNVDAQYQCDSLCPRCGFALLDIIDLRHFDPFSISYEENNRIHAGFIPSISIRPEASALITCYSCRQEFNVMYTLSKILKTTTSMKEAIYDCRTQCTQCGCLTKESFSDYYYWNNKLSVVYEEEYSTKVRNINNQYYCELSNEFTDATYNVVNAHKGDCSIINIDNCVIIYDFGLKMSSDNIKSCLGRLFAEKRIENVFLILSHDDSDHKGDLVDIIDYLHGFIPPSHLFMISHLSKEEVVRLVGFRNITVIGDAGNFNKKPLTITFGKNGNRLQVVYPSDKEPHPHKDNNRNSLIAVLFIHGNTILLTGEQNFIEIRDAMTRLGIERTEIFQFPHHGSDKNHDVSNIFVPSTYYIISGTPLPGQCYYNQRCQNVIGKMLCENRTHQNRYLIITQPQMNPYWRTRLTKSNVQVVEVDHYQYCPILLRAPDRNQPAQ